MKPILLILHVHVSYNMTPKNVQSFLRSNRFFLSTFRKHVLHIGPRSVVSFTSADMRIYIQDVCFSSYDAVGILVHKKITKKKKYSHFCGLLVCKFIGSILIIFYKNFRVVISLSPDLKAIKLKNTPHRTYVFIYNCVGMELIIVEIFFFLYFIK